MSVALASPTAAQQDFSKAEIKVERLAPGVAVLFGPGGNIGVSHGDDGNVLIDDQFAPMTGKILAAVKTLHPDPVRFVVNTHWHDDHSGGNENLGKAGAVIVAHDNVRRRMSVENFSRALNRRFPASPGAALPVVTFADGVSFHLNGDAIRAIHIANAHTDGDSLVHWQRANVLHMGDTFVNKVTFPFIDIDTGGSIDGMIAAARTGLAIAGPETKIIPGHGPMATRTDLEAHLAMLVDVRAKVAAGIAAGRSLVEIKAGKPATRYGMPDGFIRPDRLIKPDDFVAAVYESLRKSVPAERG